jgi:hypothetical protein
MIIRSHSVHLLGVATPLVSVVFAVRRDTGQRSEFPNGSTTVTGIAKFGQKVDAVATGARAEIVPELIVHGEAGRIGSARSQR